MDIVTRFLADTSQMKGAEQQVKKVGEEAQRTSKKVKSLGSNMRMTKGPTSALSTTAGQLGVQFQDVAVQAEAGTDAVRIFSQQGPQILSVFGPQGAVAGALLAIGLVVGKTIVEAFGLGEDAIKEFAKNTKTVGDSVLSLTDDFYGLSESLVDLAKKSENAAKLQIALALEAAELAAKNARTQFEELGLSGAGLFKGLKDAEQGSRDLLIALDNINHGAGNTAANLSVMKRASEELGISIEQIRELGASFVKAVDPNSDAKALTEFSDKLGEIALTAGDPAFLQLALDFARTALEAEGNAEKARLLEQTMADLGLATNTTSQSTIDFVKRLEEQAAAIGKTRAELMLLRAEEIQDEGLRERAKAAAQALIDEDNRKQAIKDSEKAERERLQREREAARERKRAIEERIKEMAAFRKMVDEEAKARDEARDAELQDQRERGETFRKDLEDEIKAQEEHEEAKRILADEQRKLRNLEREAEEQHKEEMRKKDIERTANYSNALLAIEDKLMKGKTEKQKAAFRIGANLLSIEKRENAAKIISDSYAAAMSAYKSLAPIPIIGPALGAAAAGVIIAAGASYATQSLAGRALGGQVRAGESYLVGERGPEVLTMGSGGRITPNEKIGSAQQVVNKTANVTFQITAVDASGFDQLLQSRRGQIVGMINSALNDQGKRAIA